MWLEKLTNSFVLMDEATGGEGDAAGGTIATGGDSGAEGSEGAEGGSIATGAGAAAEGEGDQKVGEAEGGKKATGDGDGDEGDDKAAGAPESYEKFEVPDGFNLNEEALGAFQDFAKGLNLTQEGAQQLIDYHTGILGQVQAAQAEQWATITKGWADAARGDQEYGGANFQENMKHVATALNKFGTPELKQALDENGMGNHPEFVRFFYRIGRLVGESSFRTGNGDSAGSITAEKTLYPDMN